MYYILFSILDSRNVFSFFFLIPDFSRLCAGRMVCSARDWIVQLTSTSFSVLFYEDVVLGIADVA